MLEVQWDAATSLAAHRKGDGGIGGGGGVTFTAAAETLSNRLATKLN